MDVLDGANACVLSLFSACIKKMYILIDKFVHMRDGDPRSASHQQLEDLLGSGPSRRRHSVASPMMKCVCNPVHADSYMYRG